MIDTLSISKQLQEAGLPQKEADAIAIQMARFAESELAGKQNLKETELVLRKEIEEVKLILQKEIEEVKLNLKQVELNLQKEIKEVELRMTDKMNAHLKWVFGFLVGQAALIVTLIKLL